MDRKMMEIGGEEARKKLFAKVMSNKMSVDQVAIANEVAYNAEEAKVARDGDDGQGERMVAAKNAARQ